MLQWTFILLMKQVKFLLHFSKTVEQLKKYIVYINEIANVLSQISLGNLVLHLKMTIQENFLKLKILF